ncbi:right-handed parallel beta-helix repeat-containing protein [Desulfobacter sp. UBA2225]|uniref:right-handed parallel beta-helix repeat-containing protein n=1 Tax=Desulfobacter sp. UBA2225 TaxID=1961413 RepID=UPI00257CF6A7|nr:right-handed parallel beta-helix repeat-containing protein [Desulfobacter sp. UBA2225]
MNIIFFVLILLCCSLTNGYGAVYYVKDTGNDALSGLSDEDAWKTINKVNKFQFSSGDTLCLKRGSVFKDATILSPNVDNFTFQDYGIGSKPLLDGDIVQPISIKPNSTIKNLAIVNVDISGQDWKSSKESNVYVSNIQGLIIDGIIGDGHKGGNSALGKTAITVHGCEGSVIVKNCVLNNWGSSSLLSSRTDFMGIAIIEQLDGNYIIENNIIFNIGSDAIHLYKCSASGLVKSNKLYNSGENCIDVKGSSNVVIDGNEFFRTSDFYGSGGSGVGDYPTHIDVHEGGPGVKSLNVRVFGNYFHDGDAAGVRIARTEHVSIEGNLFKNIATNVVIGNSSVETRVFDNFFINSNIRLSLSSNKDASCILENNNGPGTYIYENTIYNQSGTGINLILLEANKETHIYRNVVYNANFVPESFCFYSIAGLGIVHLYDNCWFKVSDPSRAINYGSRIYGSVNQSAWNLTSPGDIFVDPLLTDPLHGDYTLQSTTPCKTNGKMWGAKPFSGLLPSLELKLRIL